MAFSRPAPLREELQRALPERPFEVAFWDGSTLPPTNGASQTTFRVKSPLALAHALRAPGQLGIGRAYVAGALDVDDLDATLELLDSWQPPSLDARAKARLAAAAVRSTGLVAPPKPPAAELRPRGKRHSILRDKAAVRHHYDVSNDYFALFLDDSMTYSCAIFSRGAETLEEAQFVKRELICTKLGLKEGERVLDVGCGWGAFAVHAAVEHGVHVTGITLSEPQALRARQRAEDAGVADRVEIKVMDWRELHAEPFDAISSIGMVEHVGSGNIDNYARALQQFLKPGGRLLNHGIARLRHTDPEAAAPVADLLRDGGRGPGGHARRGLPRGLRRDATPLVAQVRRQPARGDRARRRGARACVAALPARGAARLRERVPVGLPGARHARVVSSSDRDAAQRDR
jgi:cyclopropane-fatty-acyl-phospholipid synthase